MQKSTSYSERTRLRLSRTPEFYRTFVKDHSRSGLSIEDYCRRHQVGESTFHKYRQALRMEEGKPAATPARKLPRMVRVHPAPPPTPSLVELLFPSGAILRLPRLDEPTLAALAPVLFGRGA